MSRGSSEHLSRYPSYIATPPDEPGSSASLSAGFFELAARHEPRPRTVAFVSADAELTRNAVIEAAGAAQMNDVVGPRPGTTTGRRVETPRPQRAVTSKGPHHAPHR